MPATSTIVDDFNDGTLNATLWSGAYGSVAETGGRARVPCTTGYAGAKTASSYTLDSVYMQVWAPAASTATECYVDLVLSSAGQPGGTDVQIHIDVVAGTICGKSRTGYWDGTEVPITYSATDHRWLRIQISGGNTLFEVSPDGRAWTTLRSITTPAWLGAASDLSVEVTSHRDAGTSDFAEVDNVNLPSGVLFTTQTPVTPNASDGTPGITTATTIRFAQAGTVTGVRFFATTTVSGTYTGAIWAVSGSDPGTGTLLASKTLGAAPTAGIWNTVTFDTPVSVTAGTAYRVGIFSGAGRYVATSGFFSSSDLVNGDLTADAHGDTVGGFTISQGTYRINAAIGYPNSTGSGTSYFVDADFTTSGSTTFGTATVAGAGSVTAAVRQGAGVTVTGSGSVTAAATLRGSASVTGAGATTAAVRQQAGATVTGAGSTTALSAQRAGATVAGVGSVAATAGGAAFGTATVTGTGSVSAAGTVTAGAAVSGVGTVSATVQQQVGSVVVGIGQVTATSASRITLRPNAGTTSRPYAGITTRP